MHLLPSMTFEVCSNNIYMQYMKHRDATLWHCKPNPGHHNDNHTPKKLNNHNTHQVQHNQHNIISDCSLYNPKITDDRNHGLKNTFTTTAEKSPAYSLMNAKDSIMIEHCDTVVLRTLKQCHHHPWNHHHHTAVMCDCQYHLSTQQHQTCKYTMPLTTNAFFYQNSCITTGNIPSVLRHCWLTDMKGI